MAHLVDTSILGRLANAGDALHFVAASAVVELHRRGEVLQITAQNLIELGVTASPQRCKIRCNEELYQVSA